VYYATLGRFPEAQPAAREALRLRPDDQRSRNNLRWIEEELAKTGGAAIPRERTLEAAELLNQSLSHAQAGRFRECLLVATAATEANPAEARAFNNAGFCAANLGRWDDAIRNTQEAIRLDPGLTLARNNLAWIRQEQAKAGSRGQ
jgi:Flp pilus assembly protein TadD